MSLPLKRGCQFDSVTYGGVCGYGLSKEAKHVGNVVVGTCSWTDKTMTGHEVDEQAIPPEIRDIGYEYTITRRGRVRHPEQRMVEHAFELFTDAIRPLSDAGKMGFELGDTGKPQARHALPV